MKRYTFTEAELKAHENLIIRITLANVIAALRDADPELTLASRELIAGALAEFELKNITRH